MNLRIPAFVSVLAICFIVPAMVPALGQDNGKRGAVRDACEDDYRRLCAGVAPGGGRVKKCMADNSAKLSPKCKTALGTEGKSN
jgi:hypothetical protein